MTNYCYRKFRYNLTRVVCSAAQSKDGVVFKASANLKQKQLFARMWCSYAELITGTLYCVVLLSLNGIVFDLRCWCLWLPTFEGWPSNRGVTRLQVGEVPTFKQRSPFDSSFCRRELANQSMQASEAHVHSETWNLASHRLACKWQETRISLHN